MILRQAIRLIRLLGLRRAARMKKRHEQALPYARGYAVSTCFWSLLKVGFWDDLAAADESGGLGLADYAAGHDFDLHVLDSVCSYLDGTRLVDYDEPSRRVRLAARGRDLLAEPRGLFELLYAYEPVFVGMEAMIRKQKQYGRDVRRRTDWVGIGSGRLCRQLPYPVMIDMARTQGARNLLDLGCGDGALLMESAGAIEGLTGVGIDVDAATVELAGRQIAQAGLSDRLSARTLDMFELPRRRSELGPVDCLTACDTFHEYLWESDQKVVDLLGSLKSAFSGACLVVGEFCKQSHESLRKRPTAFLEHHLFHQLTNQRIESAQRWREIFAKAGLRIIDERVFDLVGHGYFVLR